VRPAEPNPEALSRTLGLWQVTASGVGIVIGAGIYVLVGTAAREAGNALWISFTVAALLSALTGLSYAELAGLFPSAGAEYAFARAAFGPFAGFMSGWTMIAGNLIAAAAVSIGFGHYLRHFVEVDVRIAAVVLLAALTAIIAAGIQRSIWFSIALVVLQVAGLLLVIAAGAPHIGSRDLLAGGSVAGVLGGSALVFFAFIGFDEIVTLSEETKDAARNIPRALLIALAISTALYVLVGITAVSAVGGDALAASERPLALVIEDDWGARASDIIAFIALASTMNTTLLVLTAASRLIYSMARQGHLPPVFAMLGTRNRAPLAAALAGLAVTVGFALLADIGLVASVTDFVVFAIFLVVNASVVKLRRTMPDAARTVRVPLTAGGIPLIVVLAFAMCLAMMAALHLEAWLFGAGVIASGVMAWLWKARGAAVAA
jgi:APA family basic amino acid/polyamine antiporter